MRRAVASAPLLTYPVRPHWAISPAAMTVSPSLGGNGDTACPDAHAARVSEPAKTVVSF
jgi:hypothetical protein